MKIGIVGTRRRNTFQDKKLLEERFLNISAGLAEFQLVSGGCPRGADRFAEEIAKKYGLTITIHYPNWERFGRSAGFIRNTKIAEDCDILLALPSVDRIGGTEDTIKKVDKLGKSIIII